MEPGRPRACPPALDGASMSRTAESAQQKVNVTLDIPVAQDVALLLRSLPKSMLSQQCAASMHSFLRALEQGTSGSSATADTPGWPRQIISWMASPPRDVGDEAQPAAPPHVETSPPVCPHKVESSAPSKWVVPKAACLQPGVTATAPRARLDDARRRSRYRRASFEEIGEDTVVLAEERGLHSDIHIHDITHDNKTTKIKRKVIDPACSHPIPCGSSVSRAACEEESPNTRPAAIPSFIQVIANEKGTAKQVIDDYPIIGMWHGALLDSLHAEYGCTMT